MAIFCGQQCQMLLRNPKTHYKHSSLYQPHLQFLCMNQILLEWSICFFGSQIKLIFVDISLPRKCKSVVSMGFSNILLQIGKADVAL